MTLSHFPRKRFGQHFLHDEHVIARIVQAISPHPGDKIVEIGPGLGALTTHVLPLIATMDAVELDRDLIPRLAAICQPLGILNIHQADALKFDFRQLATGSSKLRVIGNLPYNISTPLLFHLIEQMDVIQDMCFMLQKEVVERIAAEVGTKAYGRLSVMIQYHCQVQPLFTVSREAFRPPPQVESAVVRLIPRQLPIMAENVQVLSEVVKQAFSQRRKTLFNCLKGLVKKEQLEALNIDPQLRSEQLKVEEFVRISNSVVRERSKG